MLALVVLKIVGVSSLVYVGLGGLKGCYYIINIIIVVASSCITKAINNFFKEILLVFSIVSGKGSSIFLKFDIEFVK